MTTLLHDFALGDFLNEDYVTFQGLLGRLVMHLQTIVSGDEDLRVADSFEED